MGVIYYFVWRDLAAHDATAQITLKLILSTLSKEAVSILITLVFCILTIVYFLAIACLAYWSNALGHDWNWLLCEGLAWVAFPINSLLGLSVFELEARRKKIKTLKSSIKHSN